MQSEVTSIMGPTGYGVEWRSITGMRRGDVVEELVVVTFHGRCEAEGLVKPHSVRGALGWTHVSDGVVLPFAEVDCERVYSLLANGMMPVAEPDRPRVFGRAIGRVIAHELYHIFTHAARHGVSGVAKPVYTVHELMADEFRFADKESALLYDKGNGKGQKKPALASRVDQGRPSNTRKRKETLSTLLPVPGRNP